MRRIRAIRTEVDYRAAVARMKELMNAEPETPDGDELDVLADLIAFYESNTRKIVIGYPDPLVAIRFRMEQGNLSQRDLIPFIGSRAKVSEVLSGKRPLTMQMARALHANLGIPASVLLQQPRTEADDEFQSIDWARFPLVEMAKRGWIDKNRDAMKRAAEIVQGLIDRSGTGPRLPAPLYRKNDQARRNAKTDPYALNAWCWAVLAKANSTTLPSVYKPGTVSLSFLKKVARLSWKADGPRLAKDFLAKHGIHLVCLSHLPRTHLDGAALQLRDGTPVIGLTLRYDRLDNFWFCLLHELAHIGRHFDVSDAETFIDDLSLRGLQGLHRDPKEEEADAWAEEGLIPSDAWSNSRVRHDPSPLAVMELAQELQVHPAIIAGRVRYETGNYRLLSHFVGSGGVRHQLLEVR